ncbi:EscU/YscU/HrcU family type III secretion system export apparatus switch protein [Marinomonas primoryensis]|jgi:flagellar biosynthesis protein|uniref:Flagellar biosynthetic protein FlhB n=1 Tax=Marinomonas primoryensis TaxID=178399 RepID=A0A859CTL0_9GAMM|nr:EscU/YscU/HrcU family type III secretion system export apparatus switch protein [Marinomonas primoryensis]QKK79633.1 FlhB/ HrpN/ YscU/ SpaS family protein [Marinomonas primoryensis]|tara:strand:- start:1442 stop:1690 length:249 start_codon:yes stop_codon:yes gene_type:complete
MQKAIALKYDYNTAPTVTAKGSGLLAEKIMEVARENDVVLHQSPELVEMLSTLELGEEIPESLYLAVAEIIAFAHKIKNHQW